MVKKLLAAGAGAALFLSAAVPAFAHGTIIKNKAYVKNDVNTTANTGYNKIKAGDDVKGGKIKTGAADAYVEVSNDVNLNEVDPCGCDGGFMLIKNKAKVKNYVDTTANTGYNSIKAGDDVKGGKIKTGDADATAFVTSVVNSNVVGTP